MKYIQKPLKEFLSNYKLPTPTNEELNDFKKHLNRFLEECQKHTAKDTSQSEEFQKNLFSDLLKRAFDYHKINTKHKIDLAIYEDNEVKAFFEFKKAQSKIQKTHERTLFDNESSKHQIITSTHEFPKSPNTLESKALYEALLYYMRERQTNNNLKYIFICTIESFFLIPVKEFERLCKNKDLQKAFKNTDKKEGNDTTTQRFYTEAEKILKNLDETLSYTHFTIRDTDTTLLYQVFSPFMLLGWQTHFDSNILNQNFYNELLYILGLQEIEEGKNKLIQLSTTPNTLSYAIRKDLNLDTKDFEKIFSLITLWNNRILFLRLLESMLISFKHFDKPFLNTDDIPNFTTLNTLFFGVLAIREKERDQTLHQALKLIPYLNSSLFDKSELEKEGKEIKLLDSKPLALYKKSILYKNSKDFKDIKTLPLLEYLFKFLNAYNFTTTPKDIQDNIKINYDKLINSSVLGLVFEKLNGYKEGSFYTPSFITSYMCKESITRIVLDTFNNRFNWNAKELKELPSLAKNSNKTTQDLHQTLLSLKICDPAVGSGHFLVSALNEIVLIAYELGILESFDFKTTLELDNDEIIVRQGENIFNYEKPSNENEPQHKIQQELFHLKKDIIESCLFGVDINPNSCEITKLRLWIELLKYSYYIFENNTNTNTLQTLPNIDINIKCGNSLISYFSTSLVLTNNLKLAIDSYKTQVNLYKNALQDKAQILKNIENIKAMLKQYCIEHSEIYKQYKDNIRKFVESYGKNIFEWEKAFGDHAFGLDIDSIINKSNYDENGKPKKGGIKFQPSLEIQDAIEHKDNLDSKGLKLLKSIRQDFEVLESMRNDTNSFEWRFEFPEVLDSNGDFKGFDLIIGNPPYIRQEKIKELKPLLSKTYKVYTGTSDIYTYFFELGYRVLKDNGILSFITSNKYTRAGYGENLREFIIANTQILSYIDLNGIKVFDSATVDTSIMQFQKSKAKEDSTFYYLMPKETKEISLYKESNTQKLKQSSLSKEGFHFSDKATQKLKAKIENIGTPLKDWDISINYGIKTGYNEAFIIDSAKRDEILSLCKDESERTRTSKLIKKMLRGKDIKRYSYKWAGLWLINTHNGYKDSKGNKIPPIDINEYPTLKAYFDEIGKNHKGKGKGLFDRDDQGITPYNLRNCAYLEEFEKEKISWQRVTQEPSFILEKEYILLDSMAFLVGDSKKDLTYLLGFLNSKLIFYYFKNIGHLYSDKGFLLSNQYVEKFPIPKIDSKQEQEFINIVNQILESKKNNQDTKALEKQLDSMVYKLYDLNDEEIAIINGGG